jgi:hypothetical protein
MANSVNNGVIVLWWSLCEGWGSYMEDNWFGVEIDIVKREIIRIVKETIES